MKCSANKADSARSTLWTAETILSSCLYVLLHKISGSWPATEAKVLEQLQIATYIFSPICTVNILNLAALNLTFQ